MQNYDCDILVVGAGPVGLSLAIDLARYGVHTILADAKSGPLKLPKMERSNPRTMEIFRRLGLVDRIREAGYPADIPMDCFIVTSLVDEPIVQLPYPSVTKAREAIARSTDGRLPREPYQLISQYTLEPILAAEAQRYPEIDFRTGRTLLSFKQDDDGVEAILALADGRTETVRARYMVGCDGGSSTVRKQLGIALEGAGGLATVKQVFFRSDDFYDHCSIGPGRHYSFLSKSHGGAGVAGVIIVQDDRRHFSLQTASPDGTDWAAEIRETTGMPIDVEILYVGQWTQHMLVASSFADKRVFLAGDSNHLFVPAGGLGMNTGIVDAYNIGWKLAAMVKGWGGPHLMASYETERRAAVQRNLKAVAYAVEGVVEWRALASALLLDGSPEARAQQKIFASAAEPLNRRVYEMHGTELGYRYESGIIAAEAGEPPADDICIYEPSTFPGCSLPHAWLPGGHALHDRLNDGYTLLKLGATTSDSAPLERAMGDLGAPLDIHTIEAPVVRALYERDFVLVRPDLHVCWRGNALPADSAALARRVTGHLTN